MIIYFQQIIKGSIYINSQSRSKSTFIFLETTDLTKSSYKMASVGVLSFLHKCEDGKCGMPNLITIDLREHLELDKIVL